MPAHENVFSQEYPFGESYSIDFDDFRETVKPINWYDLFKRALDLLFASLAIVLLSPAIVLISFLIRITSPGPAIYTQLRVGKNGRLFRLYKFRSMVDGADDLERNLPADLLEKYKKERKLVNDPRITPFGSFLRRTSLDELPQIFNIFKGEMSFVGPRPMLPDEVPIYGRPIHSYIEFKPGLTGLWQVHSRKFTSMKNRSRLDACYFRNFSFKLDLRIFLSTFYTVFTKKGRVLSFRTLSVFV